MNVYHMRLLPIFANKSEFECESEIVIGYDKKICIQSMCSTNWFNLHTLLTNIPSLIMFACALAAYIRYLFKTKDNLPLENNLL